MYQGLYPPVDKNHDEDRTLTGESTLGPEKPPRTLKEKARWPLLIWVMFSFENSSTFLTGVAVFIWNFVREPVSIAYYVLELTAHW